MAEPMEKLDYDGAVEAVTKAILFADCGNTADWKDNVDLGKAAIRAASSYIQFFRNDAFEVSAQIAERYDCNPYAASDIRALIVRPAPSLKAPHSGMEESA